MFLLLNMAAETATPEQQYQALLKQYNDAFEEYAAAFRAAEMPQERERLIREKYPRPDAWAGKFLELAQNNPKAPCAEEALIWIVTSEARLRRFRPWHEHTPRYEMIWIMQLRSRFAGDKKAQEVRRDAIEMLLRDHVASPKMGQVASMLDRSPTSAKLLRAIIHQNTSQEVKAEACLALYRQLQGDIALARQLKDNPQSAQSAAQFYSKPYVDEMLKADLAGLEAERDRLSADLTEKYLVQIKPARLIELCQELRYSSDREKLLRFLYEKESRAEVRGVACLILAQALEGKAQSLAGSDAQTSRRLHEESERLLEEAAGKYADVPIPREGTVGKMAKGIMFQARHLAIGKAAPEIEGVDQDGKRFKLSDYRGKVVLLDFWSEF
jgi:hypothetical protein